MTLRLIGFTASAVALSLLMSSGAMAQQRHKAQRSHYSPNVQSAAALRADPNAVYYGGTHIGSDPDPRIRAEILRSAGAAVGGR